MASNPAALELALNSALQVAMLFVFNCWPCIPSPDPVALQTPLRHGEKPDPIPEGAIAWPTCAATLPKSSFSKSTGSVASAGKPSRSHLLLACHQDKPLRPAP